MNFRTRFCKISILVLSFIIVPFVHQTFAQVTIGNGTQPSDGALLQLKENDNQGANSNRGLILPRVQLTGHNLDAISKDGTETAEMYTGLTVWNVRSVGDICKGVQTWTGTEWVSPMPKNANKSSYDPTSGRLTDHEGNTYSTGSFGTAGVWMTQNMRSMSAPGPCEDILYPNELTKDNWSYDMYIQIVTYPAADGTISNNQKPTTWKPEYGMLYSWALATNGKGGFDGLGNVDGVQDENNVNAVVKQRQGICPDGWHLPSFAEWQKLFDVLGEDATKTSPEYANYTGQTNPVGATGAITSAKSNTPVAGITNMPNGASKTNDKGGFDVFLTGTSTSATSEYGLRADFWTSNSDIKVEEHGRWMARAVSISLVRTQSDPMSSAGRRTNLYSVRCKKND